MLLSVITSVVVALVPSRVVPVVTGRPDLAGVQREVRVDLPAAATGLVARYLPGRVGIELDVNLAVDTAQTVADTFEDSWGATVIPLQPQRSRLRIVHYNASVVAQVGRRSGKPSLSIGAVSEDRRLRDLATLVAQPLPTPRQLGAYLELWRDAETATQNGDLRRARELWEKVALAPALDDLAALRTAELYIISGHINEAISRLQAVSRRFPRSTGATLARLDSLHLGAMLGDMEITADQVELASETVDRRRFETFILMRSAMVLRELSQPARALAHLPETDTLPPLWAPIGEQLRQDLLERTVASGVYRNDAVATAAAFVAWKTELAGHGHRQELLRAISEAQAGLGLYAPASTLLRELLRELPEADDEGLILLRLADSYRGLDDLVRGTEVLKYAIRTHPLATGISERIRGLALQSFDTHGLSGARALLTRLRATTRDKHLLRVMLATEADLVLGHGSQAAIAQVLSLLGEAGWDDEQAREPQLALALAGVGRAAQAAPLLRKWIGKTTDAAFRDRLAYRLAEAEFALDHPEDAERILALVAKSGTPFGQIARVRLRERTLKWVIAGMEPAITTTTEPTLAEAVQ